jgi:hypothetical protein
MSGPGLGLGLPEVERSRWNGDRILVMVKAIGTGLLAVEIIVAALRPTFGRTRRNCSSKPDQRQRFHGSWRRDTKTVLDRSRSQTRSLLSKCPGGRCVAFRMPRQDTGYGLAGKCPATSVGDTRGALDCRRPIGTVLAPPLGRFGYRRLLLVHGIGWPKSREHKWAAVFQ